MQLGHLLNGIKMYLIRSIIATEKNVEYTCYVEEAQMLKGHSDPQQTQSKLISRKKKHERMNGNIFSRKKAQSNIKNYKYSIKA